MIQQEIHQKTPHARVINQAVDMLERGDAIVYPTDTVYGIGCSIYKKKTIERLYKIKGKSKFSPMSLICNSIQQAAEYAHVSNFAFKILKKCFPGPYTIILEAKNGISKLMLSRQKEVGIRIPDNPTCQMLVEGLGHPILNTSVNLYDHTPEWETDEVSAKYLDFAKMFLDAGPIYDGGESTVLKIHHNDIEIIREGKGSLDIIYY